MAPVDKSKVPWWVSNLIVPLVNLTLALLVSGLFIFIAGENPYEAVRLIIYGSFGKATVCGPICAVSLITSTSKNTINDAAIKLNMMVVITT